MKAKLIRIASHTIRWTWIAGTATVVLVIIAYGFGRFWLPSLIGDKAEIENSLSQLSGQRVRIETLAPYWDGLHPGVQAGGVQVYAPNSQRPSVVLEEVRLTLAFSPLLRGDFGIHSLVVVRPKLALERLADDRFRISGFRPLEVADAPADGAFIEWLFTQGRLAIEDGTLKWRDHRAGPGKLLYLKHVNLSLRNVGRRHQLRFDAEFPADICDICSLEIDIEGNPLAGEEWGGRVNVEAVGLNIAGMPDIVRERLPDRLDGRFDLRLRTQWVQGWPRIAQGSIDATGLVLPWEGPQGPVAIDRIHGDVRWQGKGDGWRLDAGNVLLALKGDPWSAGHLRIDHNPSTTHLRVKHVELDRLVAFSRHFYLPESIKTYLQVLKPAGAIDNLRVRWDRNPEANSRYYVKADLSNIKFDRYKKLPGLKGLSGHLTMEEKAGELYLNSSNAVIDLPHVFRWPLRIRRMTGRFRWEKKDDRWEIIGRELRAVGDAVAWGNLLARLPFDKSVSPYLKLRADFKDADGAHARKYYPINKLRKRLLTWLDQSVISGTAVDGHVIYEGNTREFPFRDGNGRFEAWARIRDGVLQYLPGWEPITKAEINLLFRGPGMLITAHSGKIRDLEVSEIAVRKADLKDSQTPIRITGRITGPVSTTLAVLREAPEKKNGTEWSKFLESGLAGNGQGSLSLNIQVPAKKPSATVIGGEYSFLGGTLELPVGDFRLDRLRGDVAFIDGVVQKGRLKAEFLGEAVDIDVNGRRVDGRPETVFRARGMVSARGLADEYGDGLTRYFSGITTWQGSLRLHRGLVHLEVKSDLEGFRTALPPPYARLSTVEPEVVLRTVHSSEDRHILRLQAGGRIAGLFDFRDHADDWRFHGGKIALGRRFVALTGEQGLHLSLWAARLGGDPWVRLIEQGGGDGLPASITRLSAKTDALEVFGRSLGSLGIDLQRDQEGWSGQVAGDVMQGAIKLVSEDEQGRVELDLDHLVIPEKKTKRARHPIDPRSLPTLGIETKRFQLGSKHFGALNFWAAHTELGWRIVQLNFERPEMKVFANGNWFTIAGHDTVDFDLQFVSSDMGKTLDALGSPDQMQGGEIDLKAGFRWRHDPARPGLANLDGSIVLTAKNGTLLAVQQGAGRLAGALDFSALANYLVLNFSPALGEGFLFRDIKGRVAIRNGNTYTDGLAINGPSANIGIRGRIGLVDEDFDLVADIYPNLKGGLTVASGWLWGPQTAAWILAVQELFKKEIAEGTRITYRIKGDWSNPNIEKVISKVLEEADTDE